MSGRPAIPATRHLSGQHRQRLPWLLLAMALCLVAAFWSGRASASFDCYLQYVGSSSRSGPAGTTYTDLSFTLVDTGGCASTVTGTATVSSGGGSIQSPPGSPGPSFVWSLSPTASLVFTATSSATPGALMQIDVACNAGECFNGPALLTFYIQNDNLYEFDPTTPTTVVTNDLTTITHGVNLKLNGAAAPDQVNFVNDTTDTVIGTVYPASNGDASVTHLIATPGSYLITADVLCTYIPVTSATCPPPSLTFDVTVEATALAATNAIVNTLPGIPVDLEVEYRSPSLPAPDGSLVYWTVLQSPGGGDATLDGNAGNTTNSTSAGLAGISFVANVPGVYKVRAANNCGTSCFAPSSVTFTVTVVNRRLVEVSGNGQTGTAGQPLPDPLVVRALDNTTPAAGVGINWSVVAGAASLSPSGNTDGAGEASAGVVLGNVSGPVTVRAERSDDPSAFVLFRLVASTARDLAEVSGNLQSAPAGTALAAPLVVLASDNGAPAAGVGVRWTVTAGQATMSPLISSSDGAGEASTSVVLGNTPGPVAIRATRVDDANEFVDFSLTATAPLPIKTIIKVSGDNQSGPVNGSPAQALVARALDDGSPATGVGIGWSVVLGNASVSSGSTSTDGNGDASVTVTFGGTPGLAKVRATRLDDPGQFVDYTLSATVTTPVVKTIIKVSGDGQSGPVNSSLPQALVARALDDGAPAPGIGIDWSVILGNASVSSGSTNTDGNGDASVTVTFGATAGQVKVRATRQDDAGKFVEYTLTSTITAPIVRTIIKVSGDGQSGPVNSSLPQALVVRALDDGSPAAAVGIGWSVIAGSASPYPLSGSTDAAGETSTSVLLGASPGAVTVRASRLDDASQFVDFSLSATLVRTLLLVGGNNQQGQTGDALDDPLVVQALDNGIAQSGVVINWTVVSGAGSLSPAASTTTGSGQAQSALTLGNSPGTVTVQATRADDPGVHVTFTALASVPNSLADLPGLDDSERAVAEALDSFCPEIGGSGGSGGGGDGGYGGLAVSSTGLDDLRQRCSDLYDAADTDPAGARDALHELFPDISLVQSEAGLLAARAQFENIKVRIAALRSGTQRTSFGGLAFNTRSGQFPLGMMLQDLAQDGDGEGDDSASQAGFSRWGFFMAGSIGRADADPGDVTPGYDSDISGLTVGLDYRKSDRLIFGGTLGFTRQTDDLRGDEGSLETHGWSVSMFGTWYKADSWYSDAVLSWGRNSFDVERNVHYVLNLPGGPVAVDQTGRADSDGDSLTFAATFGRDFNKNGWGFGPYLRLLYTQLSFDEIVEEMDPGQGSGLALVIAARDVTAFSGVLGGKLTYAHSTSWGVLIPHLQFEWQHEFKGDPEAATAHFLNDPTATPFTVTGDALDSDYFRFGVGMSFVLAKGRSGFFFYEKSFSQERLSQDRFALGLRFEF